jgi:LmbE family N-acetylglucosaminyl deacetylase
VLGPTKAPASRLAKRYAAALAEHRAPSTEHRSEATMRIRRWRLLILAACCCAVAYPRIAAIWPALRGYTHNLPIPGARLPEWPLPPRGARLLIVAPHCDDEALGCAGLIQAALQRGAQVRVALMTNGDGFHLAAARALRKPVMPGSLPRVSPAEYLRLARMRQNETLHAMALLGVPERQVDFLGYPDRGLFPMWQTFWEPEHPYTSPYTQTDHSPYERAFRRHAPYCGQAVVDDLCTLLRRFRPQWVIAPHPDDSHPDHRSTYACVVTALARLNEPVVLGAYLVHAPEWPSPPGLLSSLPLTPPSTLTGPKHHWRVLPLSRRMRERKRQAVLAYASQTAVMGGLLESFVRANELFERHPPSPFLGRPPAPGVDAGGNPGGDPGAEPTGRPPLPLALPRPPSKLSKDSLGVTVR